MPHSPRAWLLLLPIWLCLSLASGVRADAARVVVWLADGESDAHERALRLELEARGIMLLTAEASEADAQAPAGSSREALARRTLARSEADAVLWLEGDPDRPVSWLRVVHRRKEAAEQAPLPHPPDAIKAELFAIAAASLLEQVLQPAAVGTGESKPNLNVAPAAASEPAPAAAAAAPAQARPRAPAQRGPAERSAAHTPEPTGKRWFVQAGLMFGLAYVQSGMETATQPPQAEIFLIQNDRYYFDDRSAWVPDGDSFDDYEDEGLGIARGRTPVPGNCAADGKVTGPLGVTDAEGNSFAQLMPSRYCARVEMPGFALVPALRLVFGRWLLPRLALGVLWQWHFDIDPDSFFGNQLFGVVAEYLLLGARGRGVTLSLLGGLTAGRTETPVPPKDPQRASVNALSGPAGLQGGALLRVWPIPDFALFATLGLGERFPAGQLTTDLSAGAELPF